MAKMLTTPDGVHHVLAASSPSTWGRRIAADRAAEIEPYIGEVESLPELRRLLAIDGYRGLTHRIEQAVTGRSGPQAVVHMAHAMRGYALGNPGLAAASFRTLDVTSAEWKDAGASLAHTVMTVLASCGLCEAKASHAALILRSLVRGFIVNEMSTPNSALDFHESFDLAVRIFVYGLPELEKMIPFDDRKTDRAPYNDAA
ncbi:MAG: TetR-like C-terminal domain-containing protein [Hyphomicrobiales bacterium]|nr:TetR-like C-terminal domain-containing protein [Hyphomicrobiales bacterium]